MPIKPLSVKYISRFATICALTIALILCGQNPVQAESRQQAVDRFADWFFYRVNPQLAERKLRASDSYCIREWNAIRSTVDREMIAAPGDCVADAFWNFDYRFHGRSLDRIAYTIWALRDLSGDQTRADVSQQEWKQLRNSIIREHFCY